MNRFALPLAAAALLLLPGCVASTVTKVATAPVKVTSKAVDLATTSQSEADRNRGRDLRKREKKLHKLQKAYKKQLYACRQFGDGNACNQAAQTEAEINDLSRGIPPEDY